MTEQFKAATIRALYGALLLGVQAFLVAMTQTDSKSALILGASTFVAYMVARGIAEGLIDSTREPTPADVGQPKA